MNKSKDILSPFEQKLADAYLEEVKVRCAANKMTVTLWLLFDTAADRNGEVRDAMLRDFKKYAKKRDVPRSVAEGVKWLARNRGGQS